MANSKRRRNRRNRNSSKKNTSVEPSMRKPTGVNETRTDAQIEQLLDDAVDLASQPAQCDSSNPPSSAFDMAAFDMESIQTLLSDQNSELCDRISAQQTRLVDTLETRIEQMLEQFSQRVETSIREMTAAGAAQSGLSQLATPTDEAFDCDDEDDASVDSILSGWEKQKQQIFADYGEAPVKSNNRQATCDVPRISLGGSTEKHDDLESLHESIDSIKLVEAEEIGELRDQLTEKLREAEIEISINRAKLDQQQAELERRQNELDRRERAMEKKYGQATGTAPKQGILDRLTKHLTLRKDDE